MEVKSAIQVLYEEIDWLQKVINQVICSYLLQEGHENRWQDIPVPDLSDSETPYADIVNRWQLDAYHRLAITLAMTPSLRPEILDIFFGRNQIYDRGFTEFGGVVDKNHSGFLPTGQTLCFLLSAVDQELRTIVNDILGRDNILIKEQVIKIGQTEEYVPNMNGVLSLSNEWLHFLITGTKLNIEQSAEFPAKKISTNMEWDDVVLDELVLEQVMEINTWLSYRTTLMKDWNLEKMIKPGYRTLFYGPPGTGKTLTATLLGKTSGKDVYKVDLSMIVS